MVTINTSHILAIDLGQFNSIFCGYEVSSNIMQPALQSERIGRWVDEAAIE